MSSVTNISSSQQYVPKVTTQPVNSAKVDADGDNDGSKRGEVETKQPPKPVSATIGNNVNTTA